MLSRSERLRRLRQMEACEVLIVGAGVNGIGTFRDLVLQGVNAVLIDRADYCSGASAASSHMIHGGLRYLENGEIRLVYEAVQERGLLTRSAPHLVKPLPTTIPIFKRFSGLLNAPFKFIGLRRPPAERGSLVIKAGLTLYDWFAGRRRFMPRHLFRGRQESLAMFPEMNPELLSTATYFDAAMASPERLAIEILIDALRAAPDQLALNYIGLEATDGEQAVLRDELTGDRFRIRPQVMINAAGPWIDHVNRSLGEYSQYIGGTKGSHLVLDNPQLRSAIGGHEIFFENQDGRIVLIFPLEDRVLLGTSDIRVDGPDGVVISDAEIDYFFGMVRRVFPGIQLERSQIVFTYSGVRPLPLDASDSTGQISRDHKIEVMEPDADRPFPVYSLVGGKWTTFRAVAKQVSRLVTARLGRSRQVETAGRPIGGGRDFPESPQKRAQLLADWHANYRLSADRAETLLARYGTAAAELLNSLDPGQDDPLQHVPGFTAQEIRHLVEREDVIHLDDLILRRTMLAVLGKVSQAGLAELASVVGSALGWDAGRVQAEIARVHRVLETDHRMSVDRLIEFERAESKEVSLEGTQTAV